MRCSSMNSLADRSTLARCIGRDIVLSIVSHDLILTSQICQMATNPVIDFDRFQALVDSSIVA